MKFFEKPRNTGKCLGCGKSIKLPIHQKCGEKVAQLKLACGDNLPKKAAEKVTYTERFIDGFTKL